MTAAAAGDDAALTDTERAIAQMEFRPRAPQLHPAGDWSTWLVLAGRGFGKTRTGAEWIDWLATRFEGCKIALVAPTMADARQVMIGGDAGVLSVNPDIRYQPGLRRLDWPGGSVATAYSAEEPGSLRGPAFHFAWADEVARWAAAGPELLSNLRLALRLGDQPRLLLTTTPLPLDWLMALAADPAVRTTGGGTSDNHDNMPPAWMAAMAREYGGTAKGRQELDGEFVTDQPGALWTRAMLDACRCGTVPQLVRVVVAVDPPAGQGPGADACGIVVAGLAEDGTAHVLADRSVQGVAPERWAAIVADAADEFCADLVVAEANNGGVMVRTVLQGADVGMNVKLVHASVGKVARAEPVAALYGRGRVAHARGLGKLEDELCALGPGGAWTGPGRSPDRADALVWALTELLLGKVVAEPRVRTL